MCLLKEKYPDLLSFEDFLSKNPIDPLFETNLEDIPIYIGNGKKANLCNLPIEVIKIDEIGQILSKIFRYNGRCMPYPVSQHSIYVSDLVFKRTQDYRLAMEGLLHDGTEAYTGDIISPVKESSPIVQEIERLVWNAIHRAYPKYLPTWENKSEVVIEMDNYVKSAEFSILMGCERRSFGLKIEDLSKVLQQRIVEYSNGINNHKLENLNIHSIAYEKFMRRFNRLACLF